MMRLLPIVILTGFAGSSAYGIPAFARKYGMPCSACHEAWPKLNNFGQVFRDNGYQLGNERDAPIFQQPGYFPMTFRMTPQWHQERTSRTAVDITPGNPSSGMVERSITTSGFDLSGLDLWTAGTLTNNISFLVLPSSDATGVLHFESAWIRFDNVASSRWFNVKLGKFELDTPISEKRFLTLSANGGFYQLYHFVPTSDINGFALGANQLGVELMGHSRNSYTRYSVSVLSSNGGQVNLPTNRSYDVYLHFNQAFELPGLGLQRVGVYSYIGQAPTYFLTSGGVTIPGTGRGNRGFYRTGAYGVWYIGKLDFSTLYMHGHDNVFLGTGTPANQPLALPAGARGPTWNGGFTEAHYTVSPQFVVVGRYELIRMAHQALPSGTPLSNSVPLTGDFGNVDALVGGYRWYPIMNSRAGLAWHQEYAYVRTRKTSPLSGLDVGNHSILMGFDFDF